jgi:glycerol uptake facilitator-like aquaporin
MKYIYEVNRYILPRLYDWHGGDGCRRPDVPLGFAPLAIGTVLAVVIFVGGHVSGGMYNPAVSLAVAVRGKMSYADMVIYWVAQLAGAAAAGYLVIYMKGAPAATPFAPDMTKALIAEFVFTFLAHLHRAQRGDGKGHRE